MSRLPSYYNMCFPRVKSLKFRLKNGMLPMFKKPPNLNGLTVNLFLGFFKQWSLPFRMESTFQKFFSIVICERKSGRP